MVIPLTASVHGATGLISSDVVYEYGKSDHVVVPVAPARVNDKFAGLLERAHSDLARRDSPKAMLRSAKRRHAIPLSGARTERAVPGGYSAITERDMEELSLRFDELYERAFGKGSGYREAGKEIMTFRLTATGLLKKPDIKSDPARSADGAQAIKGKRMSTSKKTASLLPRRSTISSRCIRAWRSPAPRSSKRR